MSGSDVATKSDTNFAVVVYDTRDPRSQLSDSASTARPAGANVAPQYFEFDRMTPGVEGWWIRSQSGIVNFVRAKAGDVLERPSQVDEYMVLVPDAATRATLTTDDESVETGGPAMVVMPPGKSAVTVSVDGVVVRIFTTSNVELLDRCANNAFYTEADPNVAPLVAWPDSRDGHRIRAYDLAAVAPDPSRLGRIYRCSTMMVNYFYVDPGPRDPSRMSPHHHDDFEQLSLQLAGDYVHHIRTPWTIDLAVWRDDEHRACSSPAVTVIPPPSIHTSQAVGNHAHHLVDIFCPPRHDFSARDGWVLNAADYPLPS